MLHYVHYIHYISCILAPNLNSSFSKMVHIALAVNAYQASTDTCLFCFSSNFEWVCPSKNLMILQSTLLWCF